MSLFSDKLFTQNPGSGSGSDGASWGNITGTLSDQTDLQTALSDKQDNLESGTNIKTVNGTSLLGEGNLAVKTYQSFVSSWHTNTSFTEFLDDVRDDSTAVQGMAYLGELRCSGLPSGLINVEAVVEIMGGSTASSKVIHVVITSGNLDPYRWEYTYWNSGHATSGWVAFQPKLTAGDNIKIENNVISQDGADLSNVLPTSNSAIIKTPVGLGEETIAYYKLDGNLDNSVTGSSVQIVVYDPSWQEGSYSFVNGKFNNCISVPNNNIIELENVFTDLSDYTIDFWAKFSASGANYTQYKVDLYNTTANAQCMLIINYYISGNNPILQIYLQKGQTLQKWIYNGSAEGIIDNGQWSHIGIMLQNAYTPNVTFRVGVVTPTLNFEELELGYNIINSGDLSTLNYLDIYGKDLTSDSYLIDELHIQIGYFVPWYKMKEQYSNIWDGTYQVATFGFTTPEALQNYVTINSQQSIIGTKTFYNGTNIHGGNAAARLRKYSQLTNGQISQDMTLAYSNGNWISKSGIITSIDSTNNTSTLSLVAGPDNDYLNGAEITTDANGKANLILTNPDIPANDNSNKVATTAWVKANAGGSPILTWYTGNTGTTVTIVDTSTAQLVKVYRNGILLQEGAANDYTISGTTLTLTTALIATDKIATEVF